MRENKRNIVFKYIGLVCRWKKEKEILHMLKFKYTNVQGKGLT